MITTSTPCHPKILAAMPGTANDFVEKSGLCKSVVNRYLDGLRARGGCHIIGWVIPVGGGRYSAVYAACPGDDVEKPEPKSRPVGGKSGKPRQRKASDITLNERRARQLGLANADRMSKTRDPLVAALFGAAA